MAKDELKVDKSIKVDKEVHNKLNQYKLDNEYVKTINQVLRKILKLS